MAISSIRDLDLHNRTLFLRLDLNCPIKNGVVDDDNRIVQAIPTIKFAREKGAKILIASHLGRPKNREPEFSLEPVATHLAGLIEQEVTLADEATGEGIELMAKNLAAGQIMMLQNIRFYEGETTNDMQFCKQLAKVAEVYVNDAFGACHRKHASIFGLPALMEHKGVGLLIEKELKYLDQMIKQPPNPFYMILGGAKVSDKIKTLEALMHKINGMCVGGAMAYAFMKAKKQKLPEGAKQPSDEDVTAARSLFRIAKKRDIPIHLPEDTIDSFDIGPSTLGKFKEFLSKAEIIFWNGPVGWFEKPEYAKGTTDLALFLAEQKSVRIVGGGDTVSAIKKAGVGHKFDHLSTGGGAVLEYLQGKGLPGISILKTVVRAKPESKFL